jgi:signal transduction histidine kinase
VRPWLLPASTLLIGAVVVVSGWVQRDRVEAHLARRAHEHVVTAARILRASTRQTAEAVDLAYQMTEARLHASALMVGAAREEARAEVAAQEGLRVWRLRGPGGESGEAGPLAEPADREAAWARPPEALFELRLGDAHLACITDETPELRSLACIDAAEISRLRAEAGPGRLFAAILAPPLLYVAVEDAEGVIAGSPGLPELSAFEDDLALREVQSEEDPEAVRLRVQPGLREGLAPFALPDGSRAVLRVGLDARLEEAIVTDIRRRHRLVFGAALGAVVLALLAALGLARRDAAEARVAEALGRAEQEAAHWRTIGQLSSTVAHEVRNPLNAIQMSAQRLALEFEVRPEDQAEYAALVGLLRSEGARVDEVVTEFLELGRPLVLARRRVDAGALLAQATLPLRARAAAEGKGLQVEDQCHGEVDLDPRRVLQVLDNLIRNGLDAVSPGGKVTVRARCESNGLVVEVEDDGPGMDPETLARAVEPFFTTKARGTGLGLPLARRLVAAHGGELALTSTPGAGTRAVLHIPPRGETP